MNVYNGTAPESQAVAEVLNAEHEALLALPAPPGLRLFASPEQRAADEAARAEIRRQREAIEAETMDKVRALAEQGNLVARGFLAHTAQEMAESAAARHGRYAGDY